MWVWWFPGQHGTPGATVDPGGTQGEGAWPATIDRPGLARVVLLAMIGTTLGLIAITSNHDAPPPPEVVERP